VATVRAIEFSENSFGYFPALDLMMAQEMEEGTYEPTIVVLNWRKERPSFLLGANQDGTQLNLDVVRGSGASAGRHMSFGGGGGFARWEAPAIGYWYKQPYSLPDSCLQTEIDRTGEITTNALKALGLPANYRSLADTEVTLPDGGIVKLASTSAAHLIGEQFWAVALGMLWDVPPDEIFEEYTRTVNIPPVKFSDKAVKTPKGRMGSVRMYSEDAKLGLTRDRLIDEVVSQHARSMFGGEAVRSELRPQEKRFLESTFGFFESRYWVNVISSAPLASSVKLGERLLRAAIKKRKVIESTLLVSSKGIINKALITGDFYIHPQAEIRNPGAAKWLADSLVGATCDDQPEITRRLEQTFDHYSIEAPMLTPADFAEAVLAAVDASAADTPTATAG
jgi:lipoate-protein ligase A